MTATKAPSYQPHLRLGAAVRASTGLNGFCILDPWADRYLIGRPFSVAYAQEASSQYWFGTVRFLHFAAGYVFLINMLARIYWGFVGNRYANWKQFIPTSRKWFKTWSSAQGGHPADPDPGPTSTSAQPARGVHLLLSFWLYGFQAVHGLRLYSAMSPSWSARSQPPSQRPSAMTWASASGTTRDSGSSPSSP